MRVFFSFSTPSPLWDNPVWWPVRLLCFCLEGTNCFDCCIVYKCKCMAVCYVNAWLLAEKFERFYSSHPGLRLIVWNLLLITVLSCKTQIEGYLLLLFLFNERITRIFIFANPLFWLRYIKTVTVGFYYCSLCGLICYVGFLEKNRDTFSLDLMELVRDCKFKFLHNLFKEEFTVSIHSTEL